MLSKGEGGLSGGLVGLSVLGYQGLIDARILSSDQKENTFTVPENGEVPFTIAMF